MGNLEISLGLGNISGSVSDGIAQILFWYRRSQIGLANR